METPNANIVGDFQTRLKKLIEDAERLSTDISAAYPTSDEIVDAIDLGTEDLNDALQLLETFDPDEDIEDDDAVESEVG